jgi:hypothetical protein
MKELRGLELQRLRGRAEHTNSACDAFQPPFIHVGAKAEATASLTESRSTLW